ncbi:hypothetical protein LTWDN19_16860 [Latilactobacillus curvatus]|uniref:Hydroxymethylglutaryl-coenzyme A synthase N-terminal domain-containing protein n=1 Tax=Latilactobacillus curvatus TaxID=28038 RepID=A0ABN6GJR9_LATCU|nr:hypothetical protein LTWDN19_16860 [Latilactobacillus curvatus]
MQIGIDKMGLFTPNTYLDLVMLANARGVDPDKYTIGIGQDQMAIAPSVKTVSQWRLTRLLKCWMMIIVIQLVY